jgi:hypothetical protein
MSYNWTLSIMDELSKDHDIKVQYWTQELMDRLPGQTHSVSIHTAMVMK